MQTTIKHVPWTCRWGQFGGPLNATPPHRDRGFVFWICSQPDMEGPRELDRDSCEHCPKWAAAETFRAPGA